MALSATDASSLAFEPVWQDRRKYEEAERVYQESLAKQVNSIKPVECAKSGGADGCQPPSVMQKVAKPNGDKATTTKHQKNKERKSKKENKKPKVPPIEKQQAAKEGNVEIARSASGMGSLIDEISRARQHIKNSLQFPVGTASAANVGPNLSELTRHLSELESHNKTLSKVTEDIQAVLAKLEIRVSTLEKSITSPSVQMQGSKGSTPVKEDNKVADNDSDDVDLFGSDEEEDEEKEKLHQDRLKAYQEKKSKKPVLIAKSNIILDIKPWDDETDMTAMEIQVRAITMPGLVWGASKLTPLVYGIFKLQISCVVEDDLVSVDALQESIEDITELVQSVDIAAFNKV